MTENDPGSGVISLTKDEWKEFITCQYKIANSVEDLAKTFTKLIFWVIAGICLGAFMFGFGGGVVSFFTEYFEETSQHITRHEVIEICKWFFGALAIGISGMVAIAKAIFKIYQKELLKKGVNIIASGIK